MKTVADFKRELAFKKNLKENPMGALQELMGGKAEDRFGGYFFKAMEDMVKKITESAVEDLLTNEKLLLTIAQEAASFVRDRETPSDNHLLGLIEPLIPEPKSYVLTEYDKNSIAKKIDVPVVDRIIEKREIVRERPIVTEIVKEVAVADTPDQIAEKINTLREKVEMTAIKGLNQTLKNIKKSGSKLFVRGGGGASVKVYDISSLLDGVTKTFTIPSNSRVLVVHFSSFPFSSSRLNTDYTSTTTSITFTSEIDATTTLAAGQSCLVEYVES